MYKINVWISKHKIIGFILCNLICWSVVYLISLNHEKSLPWWVIYGLFILFLSTVLVFASDKYALDATIKSYEQEGNPIPLLETVEKQLSSIQSKPYRQMLLMNKAAALRDLGRFDEVLSILMDINIDQYNKTSPISKIICYNNLSDIFIIKGDYSQAKIWHSKMMQLINDFETTTELKKLLNRTAVTSQAELHIIDNNLLKAEELLNGLTEEDMSNKEKVSVSLLYAKLLIKQSKPEESKQHLQFAIDYGNKTYEATRAKELLEQLNNSDEHEGDVL